jgi:hypothetical protein
VAGGHPAPAVAHPLYGRVLPASIRQGAASEQETT